MEPIYLAQAAVGTFFAISGFHKLFNAQRHKALVQTLESTKVPLIGFNQWWVPFNEFFWGAALVANVLVPVGALALLVICCIATVTDGLARVRSWEPIDWADWIDDILYLPEVLLAILLALILASSI